LAQTKLTPASRAFALLHSFGFEGPGQHPAEFSAADVQLGDFKFLENTNVFQLKM
jgi:hypothetical protein